MSTGEQKTGPDPARRRHQEAPHPRGPVVCQHGEQPHSAPRYDVLRTIGPPTVSRAPKLLTLHHCSQTLTFLSDHTIGTAAAGHFGTLSWSADVCTYVTGGVDPTDPGFAGKGGLVYIVMVHRATVEIYGSYSPDVWNTMMFQIYLRDSNLTPVCQLPSTGSEQVAGYNYNYLIDFEQSMQMLKNGGSEAILFDAKYQQSFSLIEARQTGSASDSIKFQLMTTGLTSDHRSTQIFGLSMFTHSDPSQFPVYPGWKFDINGHEHFAISGNFTLGLGF